MRALVVDDSRAIRTIIRKTLTQLGFEAVEAGNGREALEALESQGPVDVALVDWNMPEMNGYELVVELRSRPEYADLPLRMVTTETEMDQMVKALEAGANEYVMKPFTKDALLQKLEILGLTEGQA